MLLIDASNATMDLISLCRDHGQHEANASLGHVLATAKRAHALLAASWRELGAQAVIEEELGTVDAHLRRLISLVERMEAAPDRSYRAELAAECAHLHSINDVLRELLEHRAVVRHLEPLLASIVSAAAALHAVRVVACRREDAHLRWPELPALRIVGQVHLEKIAELTLAELRTLSDARFCFKRWRTAAEGLPSSCGYVFENRRYTPPQAALDTGGDPHRLARDAMAEHQERAFDNFPGVSSLQLLVDEVTRVVSGRRAAA